MHELRATLCLTKVFSVHGLCGPLCKVALLGCVRVLSMVCFVGAGWRCSFGVHVLCMFFAPAGGAHFGVHVFCVIWVFCLAW